MNGGTPSMGREKMMVCSGGLSSSDVQALLDEHLQAMHAGSPPGSVHALDLESLSGSAMSFWSVRENGALLGCGALKALSPTEGELKSMRTSAAHLRRGVASLLLEYLLEEAGRRRYLNLYLETGSGPAFDSARRLYERHGFQACGPFHEYREDPNSVFMWRRVFSR